MIDPFNHQHALAWAISAHQSWYDDDVLEAYATWYASQCETDPDSVENLSHRILWDAFVRETNPTPL